MKKLLFVILMLFAAPLMALDSGMYYNPERDGEGITLTRSGDKVVVFMFTYEPSQGCWNVQLPENGLVTEYNCHEQRWFYTNGDIIENEKFIEGWLYSTFGLDYDLCITDPNDPFKAQCGEAHIVGRYIMDRTTEGWRMVVVPFGDILDLDDPLYKTLFDFKALLFPATD